MIIIKKILFANDMNEHALFLYMSIEAYVYDACQIIWRSSCTEKSYWLKQNVLTNRAFCRER